MKYPWQYFFNIPVHCPRKNSLQIQIFQNSPVFLSYFVSCYKLRETLKEFVFNVNPRE